MNFYDFLDKYDCENIMVIKDDIMLAFNSADKLATEYAWLWAFDVKTLHIGVNYIIVELE